MKVVYIGQFDEVIVPEWENANGYPQNAKRGEPVEVPDELAARLLEQADNWQVAAVKPPTAPGRNTRVVAAE